MSLSRRMTRRAKKDERRFTLTDGGRAFLAWLLASGMPLPPLDTPAALGLTVILAIAIARGEAGETSPDAPGYPVYAWLTAHKDEVQAVLPEFLGIPA